MTVKYQNKKFWKYKVYEDVFYPLENSFPLVDHEFFKINKKGISIKKNYTFDGASGIPDTKKTIAVALPHDVFYQAIREGLLSVRYKDKADKEIQRMYKDRSTVFTSWMGSFIYWGVKYFGKSSIKSDIIEVK